MTLKKGSTMPHSPLRSIMIDTVTLYHGVFIRPKSFTDLTLKSTYVVSFLEPQITPNR